MATVYTEEKPSPFVAMNRRQFVQVLLTGLIIGVVAWGLSLMFDAYVYQAILCREGGTKCSDSLQYAQVTASLIGAMAGLFAVVRLQVFRPLLVVVAATVALWSVLALAAPLSLLLAAVAVAALYALAYALFSWIVRIRSFILALVVIVVVIVAIRLVITA